MTREGGNTKSEAETDTPWDSILKPSPVSPSPVILPPSKTMFKIHIYLGWGVRSRHREHGPLDLEKVLVVIGRALGNPDLHHIYVSKVAE